MNYSDGILSDDDILNSTQYILLQQDPHNEENKYMYQRILGNFYLMSVKY